MRGLWVSVFDGFWVLFGVVFGGGFLASGFHCVCVCVRARARLGVFGVSTGEKNILTNVKECGEGKLIWRVSLF